MPRTLPPAIEPRIGESGTYPVWLLELYVNATFYRYSSTGHDIMKPERWLGVGLRISDINESDHNAKVYAELPNTDGFHTELLVNHGIEHPAKIYRTWGSSPTQADYETDEFIPVFSGLTAGCPEVGLTVRYELISSNAARLYPFLRFSPPANNFNWPADQPVIFNRKTFKVIE